jgi:hypothetical protein
LAFALLQEEEIIPTEANDETAETAAVEVDDNADTDVDETFDSDAAETELLANARRQVSLLTAILENRLSVQED